MVGKQSAGSLHVAHTSELWFAVDSVGLVPYLELSDLATQLLVRLGVLGSLCHLRLKHRDLLVALGDGFLPVGGAHIQPPLRRLLLPAVLRGFRDFLRLVTMVITGHVSHLSVMDDTNKSVP